MAATPEDAVLLARMGVPSDSIRGADPLTGSISGSAVQRLLLARPIAPGAATCFTRRVYKRIEPEGGWLGASSHDTRLRELRLHSSGLLADLPAGASTSVRAYTDVGPPQTPAAGALLLADERGHLLDDVAALPAGPMPRLVTAIVSRLARMHAHYWCDPRLDDASLGLTTTRSTLLLTAPAAIATRIAAGDTNPYLPLARAGWDAFFRLVAPRDAALLGAIFAEPAPYVAAIDLLPRTLVHGDVWPPNLGWLPPTRRAPRLGRRLLLLDWALAAAGPGVYDPLWLCGNWHALDPVRVLAAYRAALSRALAVHDKPLAAVTWRSLVDAGYLRTVLTCGEALGRVAEETPPGRARDRACERVRWWARRAALAAERLCPPSTARA